MFTIKGATSIEQYKILQKWLEDNFADGSVSAVFTASNHANIMDQMGDAMPVEIQNGKVIDYAIEKAADKGMETAAEQTKGVESMENSREQANEKEKTLNERIEDFAERFDIFMQDVDDISYHDQLDGSHEQNVLILTQSMQDGQNFQSISDALSKAVDMSENSAQAEALHMELASLDTTWKEVHDVISIDNGQCWKIDEWKDSENSYVLGISVEDSSYFFAEINGNVHFEYNHKPNREEIKEDYLDNLEKEKDTAIDNGQHTVEQAQELQEVIILRRGHKWLTETEYKDFSKGDLIHRENGKSEELMRWNIEDKDKAEYELERYYCVYYDPNPAGECFVEEYALEYCKCNEDGEFVEGSDYELAEEPPRVSQRETPELSTVEQAQEIMYHLDKGRKIFAPSIGPHIGDREVISNYANKLDDIDRTRELIEKLASLREMRAYDTAFRLISRAEEEINSLPDAKIGLTEMHEYGYSWEGMLPVTQGAAMELFEDDFCPVTLHLLYEDGTEAIAESGEDIQGHDGIFGVEKEEWQDWKQMEGHGLGEDVLEAQEYFYALEHAQEPVAVGFYDKEAEVKKYITAVPDENNTVTVSAYSFDPRSVFGSYTQNFEKLGEIKIEFANEDDLVKVFSDSRNKDIFELMVTEEFRNTPGSDTICRQFMTERSAFEALPVQQTQELLSDIKEEVDLLENISAIPGMDVMRIATLEYDAIVAYDGESVRYLKDDNCVDTNGIALSDVDFDTIEGWKEEKVSDFDSWLRGAGADLVEKTYVMKNTEQEAEREDVALDVSKILQTENQNEYSKVIEEMMAQPEAEPVEPDLELV